MESRRSRFEKILRDHFEIHHLVLEDQSASHSGHYDGAEESHWRILLVSPDFAGVRRIQRHQKINQLLHAEFDQGLHALTLQLLTPEEWQARSPT